MMLDVVFTTIASFLMFGGRGRGCRHGRDVILLGLDASAVCETFHPVVFEDFIDTNPTPTLRRQNSM